MKKNLTIGEVMTRCPNVVPADTPTQRAQAMMRQLGIRHLPVINDDGETVGLISARDLEFISLFPDYKSLQVDAVMACHPYTVEASCPLRLVVAEMARHKYGSVVVHGEDGKPVGIFTSIDALHLLDELLEGKEERGESQLASAG